MMGAPFRTAGAAAVLAVVAGCGVPAQETREAPASTPPTDERAGPSGAPRATSPTIATSHLGNLDVYSDAPARLIAARSPASPGVPRPPAHVASRDEQRAAPAFLWAVRDVSAVPRRSHGGAPLAGLSAQQAAVLHLEEHADRYGLSASALATAEVARVRDVGRGGIMVILRQRVGDVDLHGGELKILMTRDLELVAIGGNLHAGATAGAPLAAFQLDPADAVAVAFGDLFSTPVTAADFSDERRPRAGYQRFALADPAGAVSSRVRLTEPARVKPVYYRMPDRLVPAFFVEILGRDASRSERDGHAYVVAATDGAVLQRRNLIHSEVYDYRVWADPAGDKRPADGPLLDTTPYPLPAPDGSYPGFAAPALVSIDGFNQNLDPWLPLGATESVGNNVDAYTDDDAPDGFSAGDLRALATGPNAFDLAYDVLAPPTASALQSQAAVTSLFYANNWLHDWWYDSGLTEAGGNAQTDNYGRGGVEGDPLLAEAQDGSAFFRNNANMFTPADGMSPRMQMYLWHGPGAALAVSPGNLSFPVGVSAFPPFAFDVTASVVIGDDATLPDTADGCEPITNAVAGQIVLVEGGPCPYKLQAANAQAAGAAGVIIAAPYELVHALGDTLLVPDVITIPTVLTTQTAGAAIQASVLAAPTSATLVSVAEVDSTIDNSVVAHEFGHYLHFRTAAPCGAHVCGAMSEGYADFVALMMALRPGDDLSGAFAIAQHSYAAGLDAAYFGIRRYPYSVDTAKNPLTFRHVARGEPLPVGPPLEPLTAAFGSDNAEVHNAGEVWASALFEGYVAMLQAAEGPSPPYSFAEAERRVADYLVAGIALSPENATFTEARDGILAAALAADPADYALLVQAFARRGLGTCAVSPPRKSTDFLGVSESFVTVPNIAIDSVTLDDGAAPCDADGRLDGGEVGTLTFRAINTGTMAATAATATLSTTTPGVTFPDGPVVDLGALPIFGATMVTTRVAVDPTLVPKSTLELVITSDAPGCDDAAHTSYFSINADEVGSASASDDVEPIETAWDVAGLWFRVEGAGGDHLWSGVDLDATVDSSLVSPPLDVSPTEPLVMSFTHRHSFHTRDDVFWHGAVIEVSTDDGVTWSDAATLGDPGYGGPIGDPSGQVVNALTGRVGYVGTNPAWPASEPVVIDLGSSLAGETVLVRFRMGLDPAGTDIGWEIDDISFTGLTNTPFWTLVDDPHACDPSEGGGGAGGASVGTGAGGGGGAGDPTLELRGGGCACAVGSTPTSPPGDALASLALLLSVWARRRRRESASAARWSSGG